MSFASASQPAADAHKGAVMFETWGHLELHPGRVYEGHMVFTIGGCLGDALIVHDFKGLSPSPGFAHEVMEWIDAEAAKRPDVCGVFRFDGRFSRRKQGIGNGRFTGTVTTLYTDAK